MSTGSRPDLDPVLRRAFMAPTIAEWTRVLGKSLIVSTTEDDDTAAANCAVEVVLAVDGAVRGNVTYTLPAQTVLSIATAGNEHEEAAERDPLPAVNAFFKPIATRAREMLQSSGLGCAVALNRVKDVRGHSYASPVSNPFSVHMVTQPSHKDQSSPQPVSLWFDLEVTAAPVSAPQAVGAQRADLRGAMRDEPAEPAHAAGSHGPARGTEARQPAPAEPRQHATAAPGGGATPAAGPGRNPAPDASRGPGYTPVVRTGRLEIVDETGTARAVVSTLADGSPHIVFADRDGRIRAAISLARDGQPRILFLDEMGRRILDLPHVGSSTQIAGTSGQAAGQQQAGGQQQPPAPPRRPGPPTPQGQGQQGPAQRQPGAGQPPVNGRPDNPPQRRQ
jgi:CheY-specific phosphatase CheX